jgi:hypothetical protein
LTDTKLILFQWFCQNGHFPKKCVQHFTRNLCFGKPQTTGIPLNNNFFREGVVKELESIGITATQQKERVLTCHCVRNSFVTLAKLSGIPDF